MGRHFPVREKSGNFDQTGKVREKSGKITQNTGKLREFQTNIICYSSVTAKLICILLAKFILFLVKKRITGKNTGKMRKNTGKVREKSGILSVWKSGNPVTMDHGYLALKSGDYVMQNYQCILLEWYREILWPLNMVEPPWRARTGRLHPNWVTWNERFHSAVTNAILMCSYVHWQPDIGMPYCSAYPIKCILIVSIKDILKAQSNTARLGPGKWYVRDYCDAQACSSG